MKKNPGSGEAADVEIRETIPENPANSGGFKIQTLSRGGLLISNDSFLLQIGAYPDTIKDTMMMPSGVPELYLIPDTLFDYEHGISVADLEFPVYYNYFILKRKVRFICRKDKVRPLLRVFKEAIFGPTKIDIENEYVNGASTYGFPDLKKEMAYFRKTDTFSRVTLANYVTPVPFEPGGEVEVDGVRIRHLGRNRFLFKRGEEECEVTFRLQKKQKSVSDVSLAETGSGGRSKTFFEPPVFGITVIGAGHGFDVSSRTSGFIIWINGKGVLVDPPVNSTEWLKENNINLRLIEDIILTHCHADHDSGTLQKILEERRIRLHTTETIMKSFVNKYRNLTGMSGEEFRSLFDFESVIIGQPLTIAGGEFRFRYTLHTIPTISFEVFFQGKSIVYSADSLYDPAVISKLYEENVISRDRRDDLLNFPWHHTIIFHEAGIPPIHTPVSILAALPEEVKEKLYLIHVSESALPEKSNLKIAPAGAASTIRIDVPPPQLSLAQRMLDVLAHIELFRGMTVEKALEFIALVEYSVHGPGEVIIKQGTIGDRFYMIMSGEADVIVRDSPDSSRATSPSEGVHLPSAPETGKNLSVEKNSTVCYENGRANKEHENQTGGRGRIIKTYSRYDYIGETSIILGKPRTADVIAKTELELLSMTAYNFLYFIRGTNLPAIFRRIAENRASDTWTLFEENPALEPLSPLQRTQLQAIMHREEVRDGASLFERGTRLAAYYLVESGTVELIRPGKPPHIVSRGALIGEFTRDPDGVEHSFSARAKNGAVVYRIPFKEMLGFFISNPGASIRIAESLKPRVLFKD